MKHCNTLFLICTFISFTRCNNINYYERVIKEQIRSSNNYKFRTDASEFEPTRQNKPVDFGDYDFIVVGGGSTGSVVANRLSEIKNWRVLLLEAGGFGNDSTDMPALQNSVIMSDYNWGFKTVPQKRGCLDGVNQQCNNICGQGLGGTSLLNGVAYLRPVKYDFDKWEQIGNPGWKFEEVLPYFKKSERFQKTDRDSVTDFSYHGYDGLLSVEELTPRQILTNTWFEANVEKGYKIIDYNGARRSGTGVLQKMTSCGKRADTGTSYLKPIVNRSNLRILTKAYVVKIIIKDKRTVGVEFTHEGQYYIARTRKEVILSAGVIGSPKILMLSGIGPQKHLEQLGIENIVNLEVGSNLRDQPAFSGLSFDSNVTFVDHTLRDYLDQYIKGRGPLTSPNFDKVLGFYNTKSNHGVDYPDIEMVGMIPHNFRKLLGQNLGQNFESVPFYTITMLLDAKSTGTVRLKSRNPFDYPLIDPNLLSDPENHDIDTLYKAVKLALGLTETKAFAQIDATLIKPETSACENKEYLSKDYWYCILRQFTTTGYHPTGTCQMGPNPEKGDVVDARNRVYGIDGLRVVDASVIPFPLSGNPQAVCVMMGEKVADRIKSEYCTLTIY